MPTIPDALLALDVGDKRVGVARASLKARLAEPLTTLSRSEHFFTELSKLIETESAGLIVVGLPRGLDGQTTTQTALTEQFVEELRRQTSLPIAFQDEALTSRKAEAELEAKGKPYQRADIDALAAALILDDYLIEHPYMTVKGAAV